MQYAFIVISIISFIALLSRSIMVNEKWIEFPGIPGLMIVFEFVNLVVHPCLSAATYHSPLWMLLILVAIAAILIPMHHKVEYRISHQLTEKNKRFRLALAKNSNKA